MQRASTEAPVTPEMRTTASGADAHGVIGHLRELVRASLQRAGLVGELALAEARLVALSLALMCFFAVLAALCGLGAIGLAVAGAIYGLQLAGLPLWAALLGTAALQMAAAGVLWRRVIRLSYNAEFPQTRSALAGNGGSE